MPWPWPPRLPRSLPTAADPVGVSAVKENGLFRLRTTETSLALYTFDADGGGKSACFGACAVAWPPLVAALDAKPVGDWTMVPRGDGTAQWAYKGRPAYVHAGDRPHGASAGGREGAWHLITF